MFKTICFSLTWSPYRTGGIVGSITLLNSIGLSPIRDLVKIINSSNTLPISYSFFTISSLLASILEISNIPLTISKRLFEAIIISRISSFADSGISSSSCKAWLKPVIALRGVRIS